MNFWTESQNVKTCVLKISSLLFQHVSMVLSRWNGNVNTKNQETKMLTETVTSLPVALVAMVTVVAMGILLLQCVCGKKWVMALIFLYKFADRSNTQWQTKYFRALSKFKGQPLLNTLVWLLSIAYQICPLYVIWQLCRHFVSLNRTIECYHC